MAQIFNQVQMKGVNSNTFNLSHDKKMSFNMGDLIPSLVIDTLPGDKYTINTSQMIRFAPMLAPIMHQVNVYQHYFFVPNRLLWDNWEPFITGGEDGMDNSVAPFLKYSGFHVTGTLADYLGLPEDVGTGTTDILAYTFAAYQLIFNEYYRDQNLVDKVPYKLTDGDNSANGISLALLRQRAWEHDYFTSALPWTQKGVEATIPLGTYAPVDFWTVADGNPLVGQTQYQDPITGALISGVTNGALRIGTGVNPFGSKGVLYEGAVAGLSSQGVLNVSDNHRVDLSDAAAASINDLRRAFRLQEWLEKNARGGSRYVESIKAHFGVKSSDARLQRPQYLGGGKSPVSISEVLQTSNNDTQETPQGNMAGHGINVGANASISYYCEEHGYIIGIMSVLPRTSYYQGVPKHFLRTDKFDYFWPSFAHLGEQAIQNKELFLDSDEDMEGTFGYTPRYAEYRFINSSVHGDFRTSLDFWHMSRKFDILPTLNELFITADPTKEIFAVNDGTDVLWGHIYNNIRASRKIPLFGTPTL